jgi:hypothetical protein
MREVARHLRKGEDDDEIKEELERSYPMPLAHSHFG